MLCLALCDMRNGALQKKWQAGVQPPNLRRGRSWDRGGTFPQRMGPARYRAFASILSEAGAPNYEVLLVPLYAGEPDPLGTLWVISHDEARLGRSIGIPPMGVKADQRSDRPLIPESMN
jgi:hypothetical protein